MITILILYLYLQRVIALATPQTKPKTNMKPSIPLQNNPAIGFSHIQLYVDNVKDLHVYKEFEKKLNGFAENLNSNNCSTLEEKKSLWQTLFPDDEKINFCPQNRDVINQLQSSFGFRVTGERYLDGTRSVLVTSCDPSGVQIIVTAIDSDHIGKSSSSNYIFNAENVQRFLDSHQGRQGVGVLAFDVEDVSTIKARYELHHSDLLSRAFEVDEQKVLEVFAYYKQHDENGSLVADEGTVLRFVEFKIDSTKSCTELEMNPVEATFDNTSQSAYCDHWVSNVFDRAEFLDTLGDTLGFSPKVDFNAGVVAAGEAQIESTVTGNDSLHTTLNKAAALKDQSQVYLPTNNALSSVGHVHGFLQELGQGVQHIASRVEDLVDFVQRGNEYREITGEGFTFLNIPRSYYGVLTCDQLVHDIIGDRSVSDDCAQAIFNCLQKSNVLSLDGAVDLTVDESRLKEVLDNGLDTIIKQEYEAKREEIVSVILRSRYKNLYSLLRDNVSEETYLGIVRNQILVDIQGDDLLYQIFTANILQRKAGEEAPFFEFIQRVCSESKIKPGCGGFGIRNFLTLFLSIEVSKAMQDVVNARAAKDFDREVYAQKMVGYFTDQLNESNPILTAISDAMTEEGHCKENMELLLKEDRLDEAAEWKIKMDAAAEKKRVGNIQLMECSSRYNNLMKTIREARDKTQ